jgi:hypothetical protein
LTLEDPARANGLATEPLLAEATHVDRIRVPASTPKGAITNLLNLKFLTWVFPLLVVWSSRHSPLFEQTSSANAAGDG